MDPTATEKRSQQNFDVIVVGAGVVGLAAAWELHSRGAKVLVLDRGRPGGGTTRVAAGMLAPVGELDFGERELLELNMLSAGMYPEFVASIERVCGGTLGYRRMGGMHVALDRDEAEALRRVHDLQTGSGLRAEWYGPGAARELEPGLSPTLTGAVLVEDDGAIDPRVLVSGLVEALAAEGVEVRGDTAVSRLRQKHGRVVAVELENGEQLAAAAVIAATGAETGGAEWLPPETRPPVRPVKGQILELKGDARDPVCGRIVASERVYLVPRRDGRLIVGGTVEELGFDTTITAGGIHELLREAYRLLPEVAELEFVGALAGLRPGSPDNIPVVGTTVIDGLFMATGHYRNGILLAPITARTIADLVGGSEVDGPMSIATPARFEKTKAASR